MRYRHVTLSIHHHDVTLARHYVIVISEQSTTDMPISGSSECYSRPTAAAVAAAATTTAAAADDDEVDDDDQENKEEKQWANQRSPPPLHFDIQI